VQALSTILLQSAPNNVGEIDNLFSAYDDGTNVSVYGGINRVTNPFWKAQLTSPAGAILTRAAFIKELVKTSTQGNAGGEAPDFAIMSPGDWTTLMTDFMGVEQFRTSPGTRYGADDVINAGFRGLMLGDTPIFMDPFCPVGTAYIFNSRYLALYISTDAPFAFSGFYSSIPNLQIANIGVVIVALNLVCTKPGSGRKVVGITGAAF
jgi:hypothetical protein